MKQYILKTLQEIVPNGHYFISGGCFLTITLEYSFRGWFSLIMWANSFGKKQFIVSKYSSYEWIDTYNGFFAFPFVWECKIQGYKEFNVELRDKSKDQVLYHSPWNDLY